jgi:hypothetical protein
MAHVRSPAQLISSAMTGGPSDGSQGPEERTISA